MRLIDADRLLDRCIFYHLPNGDLAVPIIDVQHAPTVEAPDINVGNIDTTTHDSIPAETGKNDGDRTSGDCISRTQAIRWVKQECNPYGKPTLDFESGKRVMEHLERMPSAQPERPTGKWIHQSKFSRIECDQCGKVFRNTFAPKNFCPNCGAKMERGEQDG